MMDEVLDRSGIKIVWEVNMPDGGRIILANPTYGWVDKTVEATNHNVFRVDRDGNILWQVRRIEDQFVNWESRNKHAKEADPNSEGYVDYFLNMGNRFFERPPLRPNEIFNPYADVSVFEVYAPGRLLSISTKLRGYGLDPDTGVATCTGRQIR